MSKKIKLSDKRREQIKRNFNPEKPPKRPNERLYWNKIKAGKARRENAFINPKTGRFEFLPFEFIRDVVEPLANENGLTAADYLKDKENRKDIKKLFKSSVVEKFYNPSTTERLLKNKPGIKIFIDDGNGLVKMTAPEALLYIQKTEKKLRELGGYSFQFKGIFSEGFTKLTMKIPDISFYDDLEELMEDFSDDEDFVIFTSQPKNKKRK